jgi:hypothetical protein
MKTREYTLLLLRSEVVNISTTLSNIKHICILRTKITILCSFFWVFPWRRFEHSICSIFKGGISRKNNRDEIARKLIKVRVGLKNSLSQAEGVRTGRDVSEERNRLWRKTTLQVEACNGRNGLVSEPKMGAMG